MDSSPTGWHKQTTDASTKVGDSLTTNDSLHTMAMVCKGKTGSISKTIGNCLRNYSLLTKETLDGHETFRKIIEMKISRIVESDSQVWINLITQTQVQQQICNILED